MALKVVLSLKNIKSLYLSRSIHLDIYLNKRMCLSINTKEFCKIISEDYDKTDIRIQKLEELVELLKWR